MNQHPQWRLAPDARVEPRPASLAMYDLADLQAANDTLWTAVARRLTDLGIADAPASLTRDTPLEAVWSDPNLLLAQTCGYPLIAALKKHRVQLVATPRYRAHGCIGPFYRSAIVVRAGAVIADLADLRGGRCVVNDLASNSGMNLLRAEVAPLAADGAFFGEVAVSGSHEASAELVADGCADLAAIDCVTLAHLRRLRPELVERLRVLSWTARSPGLPLITGRVTDAATIAALRLVLNEVEHDPALRGVRADLLLEGFNILPASHYHAVSYLEQIAVDQGYPRLA